MVFGLWRHTDVERQAGQVFLRAIRGDTGEALTQQRRAAEKPKTAGDLFSLDTPELANNFQTSSKVMVPVKNSLESASPSTSRHGNTCIAVAWPVVYPFPIDPEPSPEFTPITMI